MALYLGEDRIDASSPFGNAEFIQLFSNESYAFTAANTWEYIGLSITVPDGHLYLLRIVQTYSGTRPLGVGIHGANTISSWNAPSYNVQSPDTSQACGSGTFILPANSTHYIYGKAVGANTNKFSVYGLDFTI